MKKLFISFIALLSMTAVQAQVTKDDIKASEKRAAELEKLIKNQPKQCGVAEIDNFAKSVGDAAAFAIANSATLGDFYYRQIGETKDGVTDVTTKKPTLDEWKNLGVGVYGEADNLKTATESGQTATQKFTEVSDGAAKASGLAKVKEGKKVKAASSVMKFAKDAMEILGVETAEQGKALKSIIATLSSGKNL
jgi:hypothetical protein